MSVRELYEQVVVTLVRPSDLADLNNEGYHLQCSITVLMSVDFHEYPQRRGFLVHHQDSHSTIRP